MTGWQDSKERILLIRIGWSSCLLGSLFEVTVVMVSCLGVSMSHVSRAESSMGMLEWPRMAISDSTSRVSLSPY